MEHDGLKERLIEAAVAIDRSGMSITMSIRQGGIRMYMLQVTQRQGVIQTENFTGWNTIEGATHNPLLVVMRELINQMKDIEGTKL